MKFKLISLLKPYYFIILTLFLFFNKNLKSDEQFFLNPDQSKKLATLYEGRIRPFSVAAKLWFYEISKKYNFEKTIITANEQIKSVEDLLWQYLLFQEEEFFDLEIINLTKKEIQGLSLNDTQKNFSFNQIQKALIFINEKSDLALSLKNKLFFLKNPPIYPVAMKYPTESFESLNLALKNSKRNSTAYSDNVYKKLKNLYNKAQEVKNLNTNDKKELSRKFVSELIENYDLIQPHHTKKAHKKSISAPSLLKLQIESYFFIIPFTELTIFFYILASALFIFFKMYKKYKYFKMAFGCLITAFLIHALILIIRSYILMRPFVSNMNETLIFVPIISVLASFIFYLIFKKDTLLLSASIIGSSILFLSLFTPKAKDLETLQAVIDSNFWLSIHVLMIVASYGFFLLSSTLAHLYIFKTIRKKDPSSSLYHLVLNSCYAGISLLIPGTILGGIWAQNSWGRFWDWDPKESWAFIACSCYALIIHLHRYNYIKAFGFCIGSIIGFLVISFTWYGVNYLIGTGLHSYGFSSGGSEFYFGFIILELIIVIFSLLRNNKNKIII
jgi:ABC-type transport system involved in cytochrome c biogenesis permease subunit